MKFVPFRNEGETKAREFMIQALEVGSDERGMNMAVLRTRLRVLDALKAAEHDATGVELEDADHNTLRDAVEKLALTRASHEQMRALVAIADDVRNAKAPPKKTPAEKTPAK